MAQQPPFGLCGSSFWPTPTRRQLAGARQRTGDKSRHWAGQRRAKTSLGVNGEQPAPQAPSLPTAPWYQGLLASPQTAPHQYVQNQDTPKGSLRPCCCVCDHHPAHPEQASTSALQLLQPRAGPGCPPGPGVPAKWFMPCPGLPRPAGAPTPRPPSTG